MNILDNMIVDFDSERRILHFTASEPIRFDSLPQLEHLYEAGCALLDRYAEEDRCYMLVDLSKFVIEPSLFGHYSRLSTKLKERYLYPGGFVGYGFEITRITVQLSYGDSGKKPPLFKTRREAEEYLESLISKRLAKSETGYSKPIRNLCE